MACQRTCSLYRASRNVLLPTAAHRIEHGFNSLFTLKKKMANRKEGGKPRGPGTRNGAWRPIILRKISFLGVIIDNSLVICRVVILITTLYVLLPFLSLCRLAFVWGKEIFLPGPDPSLSGPENIRKMNNSVRKHINLYGLIPVILEAYLRIKTHSWGIKLSLLHSVSIGFKSWLGYHLTWTEFYLSLFFHPADKFREIRIKNVKWFTSSRVTDTTTDFCAF
jgi:hypothetical protein